MSCCHYFSTSQRLFAFLHENSWFPLYILFYNDVLCIILGIPHGHFYSLSHPWKARQQPPHGTRKRYCCQNSRLSVIPRLGTYRQCEFVGTCLLNGFIKVINFLFELHLIQNAVQACYGFIHGLRFCVYYSHSIVEFFHSFESLVFQRFTQFISERFLPFDCIFVKFGCHLVVTDIIRVAPCSRSLKAEGGSLTHIFSTSN